MTTTTCQYTTADLAERVQGTLHGRPDLPILGVNSMDAATADEITFIADQAHARRWREIRARAALVSDGLRIEPLDVDEQAIILVADAELAVIEVLELFAVREPLPPLGIDPDACVHPTAGLGREVRIGPHVSVGEGVTIGDRVVLHAGVRVYSHSAIGDDSILHANCVVRERCTIGRRVILNASVSIGSDGFNYRPGSDGAGLRKVPQIGTVTIGDDVEIGANSCVDRAKFGETSIGAGTKIDNLVQIGHNCRIGRNTVIAGMTGIGGSTVIGDWVRIAGAVGIADHLRVGDGATIGAKSGVTRNIPAGATWVGYPAREAQKTLREWAMLSRLPALVKQVNRLLKDAGK